MRHEDRVGRVAFGVVHRDRSEAGVGEELDGDLLAPRRTQSGAALGQRHGHAVQQADAVDDRRLRRLEVVGEHAGDARLVHQEPATRPQRLPGRGEHLERAGLVVHRVEDQHCVERLVRPELRRVRDVVA